MAAHPTDTLFLCDACSDIDILGIYVGNDTAHLGDAKRLREYAHHCSLCNLFRASINQNTAKSRAGTTYEQDFYESWVLPEPLILRRPSLTLDENEENEDIELTKARKARNAPLREVEVVIPTKDGGDIARVAVYAAPGISYTQITSSNIER